MLTTLLIALLIAVNAFYVAAEFALVGVGRARAGRLARTGSMSARLLDGIVGDPGRIDRAIAACQIGITVSSLALGAFLQARLVGGLESRIGERAGAAGEMATRSVAVTVALVLVSALQMVLGEIVPKSLAVRHPERWALASALPLELSGILFAPLIAVLNGASSLCLRLLRVPLAQHGHLHSPAEIGWMVAESARTGAVRGDLGDRLHDALRFAAFQARDTMVPRVRVRAVAEDLPLADLRRTLWESDHTRLPVYRGSIDRIVGVIHAKDVALRAGAAGPSPRLGDLMRPIPAVPWTVLAPDLLERMRRAHAGMAVLVDEHGGTAGIVTLEDLIEQVLGEFEDEFDPAGPPLGLLPDGRVRLRGSEALRRANARHGLALASRGARTVGGLVMETLGRVARAGDTLGVAGGRILVEQVTGRSIDTVLVAPDRPARGRAAR